MVAEVFIMLHWLPRKHTFTFSYGKFVSAECSMKNRKCAGNKTDVVIRSSPITDTFYETHLIDVPLDLFNPARKEEEYCSLDRKENIQLKKCSASSAAQYYISIYCVLTCHLSACLLYSNYSWGVMKTFPFLVWYTSCHSFEFVLWDGQACRQKAE